MTQPRIVAKLETLLTKGIATEEEALYLMAEVRKLLEQQEAKQQYEYLTFHCDWALHAQLKGTTTQKILKLFDAASVQLRKGIELHDLTPSLKDKIYLISKMKAFRLELERFLQTCGLPGLDATRPDGWVHFLHLYARIVEDCPLVIRQTDECDGVASVTLNVDVAQKPVEGEMLFRVTWTVLDKNGESGEIFVINSFSLTPSA